MAGSVKIETTFTLTYPDGSTRKLAKTATVTNLSDLESSEIAIAASATNIIWDPTVEATERMASFDFLALISDGILDVEFTANEAAATEELDTKRLIDAIPLMLGADDSFYGHTASNAFGGTLDVIDKIRVKEPAAAARRLIIIMGKKSA